MTVLHPLIDRLRIDAMNQRLATDPWQWKVHCMLASWRIRNSHGPKANQTRHRRDTSSWEMAVLRMQQNLSANAKQQSRMLTWEHWAGQRAKSLFRYQKPSVPSTDFDCPN